MTSMVELAVCTELFRPGANHRTTCLPYPSAASAAATTTASLSMRPRCGCNNAPIGTTVGMGMGMGMGMGATAAMVVGSRRWWGGSARTHMADSKHRHRHE